MPKKSNLPIEVHDHFAKANVLHTYVQKHVGEAQQHALETGQELLAAKKATPHGSWEEKCEKLFDGSLRTAQFYMQFAKNVAALPKKRSSALLLLEGSLDGAAKAAKKAAAPPPKSSGASSSPGTQSPPASAPPAPETPEPDYGKCPNCGGTEWNDDDPDGAWCAKCHHPHGEPAGDPDEDRLNTQRQKTVKTTEALLRAFDDLQGMWARPEHEGTQKAFTDDQVLAAVRNMGAIRVCKALLKIAREWK